MLAFSPKYKMRGVNGYKFRKNSAKKAAMMAALKNQSQRQKVNEIPFLPLGLVFRVVLARWYAREEAY